MRAMLTATLLGLTSLLMVENAKADNSLTPAQLVKATQLSLDDYTTSDEEMARSISGFRVSTVGNSVQVILEMNTPDMQMSVKYRCNVQGQNMICNQQQ